MITLLYHIYIEHEIYNMEYNKVRNCINGHKLIDATTIKWYGYIILLEVLSNEGY